MKQLIISIILLLITVPFLAKAADDKKAARTRIAINGFGRIGRNFLRAICADSQATKRLEVVAINVGPSDIDNIAHIFIYDSVMGTFEGKVDCKGHELTVNDQSIKLLSITDHRELDWQPYNIDWVVESSGKYTTEESCRVHAQAGAKRTLITAPCKGDVTTIVPGVNDDQFDPEKDEIVSLASCTTNAITPLLKILHDAFHIEQGVMTATHAYTNTQVLLDAERGDRRRSRAAALNIIPASTGAAQMIDRVIPELKGRIQTTAVRVPVAVGSLIQLVITTKKELDKQAINGILDDAAKDIMSGVLATTSKELVSSDYALSDHSVVVDKLLTQANGHMGTVFGWYNNERGYSTRLKDFLMNVS